MTSQQFHRVLLHSQYELDRFDVALSRLSAYQFPSEVAKDLIAIQEQESKRATAALKAIVDDYSDDPAGASSRLNSEYRKLTKRRYYLDVLEKARSDEVPWSLVPSIERLASLILPNRKILMTTTPHMNYSVNWSQPIVTLFLPKLHRANAFLHVLIGHELFHPAIGNFFPGEESIVSPKLRDECKKLLGMRDVPDLFSQKRLDNILSYATEAWRRGLEELMCDMGAASLFGPAALWTISGLAASQDLDVEPSMDNQFYPPWRMRIKTVLEYVLDM